MIPCYLSCVMSTKWHMQISVFWTMAIMLSGLKTLKGVSQSTEWEQSGRSQYRSLEITEMQVSINNRSMWLGSEHKWRVVPQRKRTRINVCVLRWTILDSTTSQRSSYDECNVFQIRIQFTMWFTLQCENNWNKDNSEVIYRKEKFWLQGNDREQYRYNSGTA